MHFPTELLVMFASHCTLQTASRLRRTNHALSTLITPPTLALLKSKHLLSLHGPTSLSIAVDLTPVPKGEWDVSPYSTANTTDRLIPLPVLEMMIPMMIELGADPKCGGGCALRGAVRCGSLRLVKWLLGGGAGKGVVFDVCSLTMETQRACGQGRADLVEALLDGGGEVHDWALCTAVQDGHLDIVYLLLARTAVTEIEAAMLMSVAIERGFGAIAERMELELLKLGGELYQALPRAVEVW